MERDKPLEAPCLTAFDSIPANTLLTRQQTPKVLTDCGLPTSPKNLGNQSRARHRMYWELSRLRQMMNDTPHIEPTGEEVFPT